MAERDDAIDADVAELRAGARRLARRRSMIALGAGLATGGAGAPIYFWGAHMNAIQAHSEVHFMLPDYAQVGGLVLFAAAGLLVMIAIASLLLSLR